MKPIKRLCILILPLTISSCQANADYAYLMQHPYALSKAVDQCQKLTQPTAAETAYCKDVGLASNDFRRIFREQQMDPLRFGQRIMEKQMQLVRFEEAYQQALQQSPGRVTDEKIQKLKHQVAEARYQVNVLLAVTSMNAPD